MKPRRVVFAPEALDDLNELIDWISNSWPADTAQFSQERLRFLPEVPRDLQVRPF